ncbi:NB-ARC domain-containing protein [Streptomyces sp. NPDC002039]|uniref:ATP-binding protein n=1 Tax=Streptomyces sp. NPDC002039 TaxID=3154660 RepID=UPI003329D692
MSELIGREEVRESLDRHLVGRLSGSTPTLLAITGMPGVGKSALALDWGNDRAHLFPDGQLYVDLRSLENNAPMTPSAALHGFLAALGHPASSLPKEIHELSAMYRTALAGRRMLILLDNAHSADQVRPLLPNSPGSVTVVTSRSRLAGLTIRDGAVRIDLDCLSAAASVHLLAKLIGTNRVHAEPEAAATLASLCGNLPLALQITAERLASHPVNPLSEWVGMMTRNADQLEHLDIPGDPTTSVRAVFSWSYLALPAATSRLFRHLGLSDEPEFEAAQVIRAFDAQQPVEAHLAMLVDASLLTSPVPGRYRLHKLVHLYARERAEAEEGSEYMVDFARRLRRSRRVIAGTYGAPPLLSAQRTGAGDRRPDGLGERGGIDGAAETVHDHGPTWRGWQGCCPVGLLDSECQGSERGASGAGHAPGGNRASPTVPGMLQSA